MGSPDPSSRPDSPSAHSFSSSSSIDPSGPPTSPINLSRWPIEHPSAHDKAVDTSCKPGRTFSLDTKADTRCITIMRAIFWVVLASSGGFFMGQGASSSILTASSSPPSLQSLATFFDDAVDCNMDHNATLQHHARYFLEKSFENWIETRRRDGSDFIRSVVGTTNSSTTRKERTQDAIRSTRKQSEEEFRLAQRKRFAEYVIHPVLLTILPLPTSIAIAIDEGHRRHHHHINNNPFPLNTVVVGNELARDLLSEILVYPDIARITIMFVAEKDSQNQTGARKCPLLFTDIVVSTGRKDIDIECSYINPYKYQNNVSSTIYHHDVSVVLASCGEDLQDNHTSEWEKDVYAMTNSVAVKCVGKTYPLDHPARLSEEDDDATSSNVARIEQFFVDNAKATNPSHSRSFARIIDYEIFNGMGVTTTFAVAFRSIKNGFEQWRLTEANYKIMTHQRWGLSSSSSSTEQITSYFDSADMLRIQYPSRHNAVSSCAYYGHLIVDGDDDEFICEEGLDTTFPNVASGNFYVDKSSVGENAGRGIFTSIDLEQNSYIMAELFMHDAIFGFRPIDIVDDMVYRFCIQTDERREENEQNPHHVFHQLDSFHCIVGIYIDAYAYGNSAIGTTVNTGINTFINHGCNGKSNIMEDIGITEFTMLPDGYDPDPATFVIPAEFLPTLLYNPNYDRNGRLDRFDSTELMAIHAQTELLDDYTTFGEDKYFLTRVVSLKEQCLGSANIGSVVSYEDKSNRGSIHKYDTYGSRFIMDWDDKLVVDKIPHRYIPLLRNDDVGDVKGEL